MKPRARALFLSKIDRSAGPGACHPWTGCADRDGYGWFGGKHRHANTIALEFKLGRPLAPGMCALHTCDNPPCCNEAHLYEGTKKQNRADAAARGRIPAGDNHWTRRRPELVKRGDEHHSRTQPGRMARGERNGAHTRPEQVRRGETHGRATLTDVDIRDIRAAAAQGASRVTLADTYNVSTTHIGRIVRRESWGHVQ
jgi:hypothetical protein